MIKKSEFYYVNNIFIFDKCIVKEIMVFWNEMVSLLLDSGLGNMFWDIIKINKYIWYFVVKGDKDYVVGIINIKEVLFRFLLEGVLFIKYEFSFYI